LLIDFGLRRNRFSTQRTQLWIAVQSRLKRVDGFLIAAQSTTGASCCLAIAAQSKLIPGLAE
jgi:hypothetical protein